MRVPRKALGRYSARSFVGRNNRSRPRIWDLAAILLSTLAIGAFSVLGYAGGGNGRTVIVEASGDRWIYPLGVDRVERVRGPIGDTVVEIREGKARVENSPCRDKLCVNSGLISRPGQWIACLPNGVFVRIEGGNGRGTKGDGSELELDGVSF